MLKNCNEHKYIYEGALDMLRCFLILLISLITPVSQLGLSTRGKDVVGQRRGEEAEVGTGMFRVV